MKLIGFSGPPRSGKDTLGNLLANILRDDNLFLNIEVHALSLPMRLAVYGMLGLEYSVEHYEANKDYEFDVPGEMRFTTIRQEMIALSEKHVKPRLGHGWWGRALLNRVTPGTNVVIVTDMGFEAEQLVFEAECECEWIHLYRNGCDFSKDSRSYVGKPSVTVGNNADPDVCANTIFYALNARWSK